MRRLLVDTHVVLWTLTDDPRLSAVARATMGGTPASTRYFSLASAYEIAVKVSVGKLALARPIAHLFAALHTDLGLQALPVTHAHCACLAQLPLHHRDPFDRLLVAQARVEGLAVLTADAAFAPYDVELVW